jgi:hypothetical protein
MSTTDYPGAFPNSHKTWVEGPGGVRVPMREIQQSGGEPPLRVYDTSGPRGTDVREGLPALRDEWIRARDVRETGRTRAMASDGREHRSEGTASCYHRRANLTCVCGFRHDLC